jgi:hypothetical protein
VWEGGRRWERVKDGDREGEKEGGMKRDGEEGKEGGRREGGKE